MKLKSEYKEITRNILEDKDFLSLKEDTHHGSTRYDHCKRVSYLSFLMAKTFKGDYEQTAKAGLLHDYFHGSSSYLEHPKESAINAKKNFDITDNEAKIIETHMYHYALIKKAFPFINKNAKVVAKDYRPTSKEGFIVCISDLLISIFELCAFKIRYNVCLYVLFFINFINY